MKAHLKKLGKAVFATAILCLLFYLVDLKELWLAFSNLTLPAIVNLLLISAILIYISALKWSYFLEAFSGRVSVLKLFNLYLVGYFVNLLMPSYLGGDAVRSYYAGKKSGQHEALTATILERYTGLAAMLMLGLIFMWFSALATLPIKLAVAGIALALATITVMALSPRLLAQLGRIPQLKDPLRHLQKIQAGFILAKSNHLLLIKALALSFLYHSVTVANTMAAGMAVGWYDAPVLDLFVVLPLILVVGALPFAPQGLGIQEGAFFYFLQGVGATPAQALGIALILRAKSYVLALSGGIAWLFVRSESINPDSETI